MNGLYLEEALRSIESDLLTLKMAGGRESDPANWDQLQLLSEALKDLPSSWREPHPGVFKPTWTFVGGPQFALYHSDSGGEMRITDCWHAHLDSVVDNLESAQRGVFLDDRGRQLLTPLTVPVCGQKDVAVGYCRACGGNQPMVFRSDLGTGLDRGFVETKAYVLCLPCRALTLVGTKLQALPDLSE